MGDIAIFVDYDSADVWANRDLFRLREDLDPESVMQAMLASAAFPLAFGPRTLCECAPACEDDEAPADATCPGPDLAHPSAGLTPPAVALGVGVRRLQGGRAHFRRIRRRDPIPEDVCRSFVVQCRQKADQSRLRRDAQGRFLVLKDTVTGQDIRRLDKLPDGVCPLAFSPDGKTLAWAGWKDPTIHLVEVLTGQERRILSGHGGRILKLAFSGDGKRLISSSTDTTALIWDLSGNLGTKGRSLTPQDLDTCWAHLAGAMPVATDALNSRAPSKCVARLCSWAHRQIRSTSSYGWMRPPPRLCVFSRQTSRVRTRWSLLPRILSSSCDRSRMPCSPGSVRQVTPDSTAGPPASKL